MPVATVPLPAQGLVDELGARHLPVAAAARPGRPPGRSVA